MDLSTHLSQSLSQCDTRSGRKRRCVSPRRGKTNKLAIVFKSENNLKVSDGMFYSNIAGKVAINDHIADICERQQFVIRNIEHGAFFEIAIRASNPQNLRCGLLKARYIVWPEGFCSQSPELCFAHAVAV